ncbi:BTAD domain-containing putative transcriptional regulator [Micromonospora soli]|uniref:AfsR/SARP family transcriptional regulator n=1 Tax=Micromonospora sp. NBRC 110009 TaxID=3061627 RepID=UPI002673780C|nr:BTAD domain-containing putative transcriptional regulator [Micromonospora sp. NBRC 110009]WKU02293.1 BTAD domain-containing putative transcriptional regulator [Micromonospora sp. NBRC 110009]
MLARTAEAPTARPGAPPGAVLQVLAGPRLLVGGKPLTLPESSLRFLVFLAFRRRPVPRRAVAAALWPDSDEARAAGNLRSAMWRLRGSDAGLLDIAGTAVAIGSHVAVDLDVVNRWAERIIRGTAEPADLRVPEAADAALDLLPGWYDDWVIFERERVRARTLHALEQVSRRLSAAGRHAQAVEAAIAAVCSEPLRESAQRALILAHLAEGNQVEAYRTYQAYQALVSAELGVTPSDALRELVAVPIRR